MFSLRSYKTNLDYTASESSLYENYSIVDMAKGNASFSLPAFPENRVQVTSHGFVKIFGITSENDEQILKVLAAYVKTVDSQDFTWKLHKQTRGEKELLKELDLKEGRTLLKFFLDKLDDEVRSFPPDSSYDEVNVGRKLLTTIRPKVDSMNDKSIDQSLLEVWEAIDGIDKVKQEAIDPDEWRSPND
jgi:hypothetical protein